MTAKTEKLSITVPKQVADELRKIVPQGKLSAFISEIIESAVQMEKQKKALEAGKGAWKDENHPELKTPEDTQKWLRELRARDLERLERLRKSWEG